ncbi:MAG: hypothetical protein ACTSPD_15710 [Promethearchaeota archaeon]
MCKQCGAKFSVFYDPEAREFYTNLLKRPKIKAPKLKTDQQLTSIEKDAVKYCIRCGLHVGPVVKFCMRCGLKINRI